MPEALVESIFMYNSEIWGLKKTQEKEIDIFKGNSSDESSDIDILRAKKSGHQTNNCTIKEQTPWSQKIKSRRLRFFGHI